MVTCIDQKLYSIKELYWEAAGKNLQKNSHHPREGGTIQGGAEASKQKGEKGNLIKELWLPSNWIGWHRWISPKSLEFLPGLGPLDLGVRFMLALAASLRALFCRPVGLASRYIGWNFLSRPLALVFQALDLLPHLRQFLGLSFYVICTSLCFFFFFACLHSYDWGQRLFSVLKYLFTLILVECPKLMTQIMFWCAA